MVVHPLRLWLLWLGGLTAVLLQEGVHGALCVHGRWCLRHRAS